MKPLLSIIFAIFFLGSSTGQMIMNVEKLDSSHQYFKNQSSGNLELTYKDYYSYDDQKNMTLHLEVFKDPPSGSFINSRKMNYSYDANNNVTMIVFFVWNAGLSAWANSSEFTYTYNSALKVQTQVVRNWIDTIASWANAFQMLYQYDSDDFLIEKTTQSWDVKNNLWINYLKSTYTKNPGGQTDTETSYYWDVASTSYLPGFMISFSYTLTQKIAIELEKLWDTGPGAWIDKYRRNYTYDGDDFLTDKLEEAYDTGTWNNKERWIYTNNILGNQVEILDQTWSATLSSWNDFYKQSNFWSNFMGLVDTDKTRIRLIYRNPYHSGDPLMAQSIYGSGDLVFTLLTISGIAIESIRIRSGIPFRITIPLASGVYLYSITEKETMPSIGKMIVEN